MNFLSYIILFFVLLLVASGLFIVKQQTAAIIERFGRFLLYVNQDCVINSFY